MFAYADYVAPLRDIVLHFKFKGITAPARLFASLLHDTFEKQLVALKADLLVPVPLHPSRERQRGYNQATLFASEIGRLLDLAVRGDLLVRVRKRKPQANLKFDQRAENVRDVFECECGPEVRRTVILVDDVVTSGATVREAKRILEAAGCDVCAVVAIAHGR
jgi:ComF family protein